jgi:DNA-binding LacI/PurR family transcriptional regulator
MPRRITIRDIAAKANVHFSTVGRALSNDPRLSPKTVHRIKAIALEMRYSPDPAVTALSAYRSASRKRTFSGTVAFLTSDTTRDGWKKGPDFIRLFQGASQRAKELGYNLEEVWIGDLGPTPESASRRLYSRGIQGILIAPSSHHEAQVHLDWNRFSAVRLSITIAYPKLHLATTHQYLSMVILMEKLRKLGYHRIALSTPTEKMPDQNWLAGYWVGQQHMNASDRLPALFTKNLSDQEIRQWLHTWKPDAIVLSDWNVYTIVKEMGWNVPGDIGVAFLDCPPDSKIFSGMTQNFNLVGIVAFDHLVATMHRGERGIPSLPVRLLVEGTWVEGTTVRLNCTSQK